MNVVQSTWCLNQVCPSCEQGDTLGYLRCSECGAFVLVCEEERIEFEGLDPHDVGFKRWRSDSCGVCEALNTLRDVTSGEMIELGLTKDDYH